jgi:hypothetical protein
MRIDHSLRPDVLGPERPDEASGCGCPPPDVATLADQLDDRTIAYVLETRPHFEGLRQAISQIAGMLVLATAGAKSVTQDHAMFGAAKQAHGRALDGIRAVRPSARAQHHHRHLIHSAECLGVAIAKAGEELHIAARGEQMSGVLAPLQTAYRNLHWAADSLPGFEVLDFNQACCAPQA